MKKHTVLRLIFFFVFIPLGVLGQNRHMPQKERIDSLVTQGTRLYYEDKEQEALPLINEALSLLKKPTKKNGNRYSELLRIKSGCLYYIDGSDPQEGIEVTKQALSLYNQYGTNDTLKCGILEKLGYFYTSVEDWDNAEENLILGKNEAIKYFGKDSFENMRISSRLVAVYCIKNDINKATEVLWETLPLQKTLLTDSGYYDMLIMWHNNYYPLNGSDDSLCKLLLEEIIERVSLYEQEGDASLPKYYCDLSEIDARLGLFQESYDAICKAEAHYTDSSEIPLWAILQQKAWTYYYLDEFDSSFLTINQLRELDNQSNLGIEDHIDFLHLALYDYTGKPFTEFEFSILNRLISKYKDDDRTCLNLYDTYGRHEQDPYKAIEYYKKAIEVYERGHSIHDNGFARTLRAIGNSYYSLHEYQEALSYYSLAIDVFQRVDANSIEFGGLLEAAANTAQSLKNYGLSVSLYEKAYSLYKNSDVYAANLIRNLVNLYSTIGNYEKYQEYLDIYKNVVDENDFVMRFDLAMREIDSYISSGDIESALRLYSQYLKEYESIENLDDYSFYNNYISESFARVRSVIFSGDESSFEFFTNYLSQKCDSWETADSWVIDRLAGILYTEQKFADANFLYKLVQSEEIDADYLFNSLLSALFCNDDARCKQMLPSIIRFIRNQFKVVIGLTESEKESYWSSINHIKDILFSQRSDNSQDEDLFEVVVLSKNFIQKSGVALSNLMINSSDTTLSSMSMELRSIRNRLGDLHSGLESNAVDSLKLREIELSREIGIRMKDINPDAIIGTIDYHSIVGSLGPNDLAVEIVSYHNVLSDSIEDKYYGAYVLYNGCNRPDYVPLFCDKDIKELLSIAPQKLYDPDLPFSNQLYDYIIRPLQPYLKNVNRVYISMDGILNTLAIEAITMPSGKHLEDEFDLMRLSSTADLGRFDMGVLYHNAVVYGGLDYEYSNDEGINTTLNQSDIGYIYDRASGEIIKYLPATKEEAEKVSRVLSKNHIESSAYIGREGTEESFKSLSGKGISIVHIATHGFYKPQESVSRTAYFNNHDNEQTVTSMQRSGLLLAGCSNAWKGKVPADREDGVLTASEIEDLDLSKTRLVVLSACETGLGDITEDGIEGLQRAFKNAGVQSLIMSLWKVDDKATELLMTEFYSLLAKGQSRYDAFNNAKNNLKRNKRYSNPYFWAGFIMLD